jgi:deoxycytidylate deaminase
MQHIFPDQEYPELFFGIVAPIGVDTKETIDALERQLRAKNYHVVKIKITDVFKVISRSVIPDQELVEAPIERRFSSYISYGDQLRAAFRDNSFLSYTCIAQLCEARRIELKNLKEELPQRIAYIIAQFKRKEEVDVLRTVYGTRFFQLSVYSSRSTRVDNLATKIAKSHDEAHDTKYRGAAEDLVARDENEIGVKNGQRVSDVFHEADLIVHTAVENSIDYQINRFINLIFGANSYSPTKIEYGLYIAKTAALRSLDLSRQVGAAIFTDKGEIVSLGANEVPRRPGGTYWCDEAHDDRDFKRGVDSNDARKKQLLREIVSAIAPKSDVDEIIRDESVANSQFMDALEYGRIIHAEMSAICDAARLGRPLAETTLFCTTFPCHMCAKLIVASGVKKVIFLEPYPKSLVRDLHSDSVEVVGHSRGGYEQFAACTFSHFYGVSPKRYRDLFERKRRKDHNGYFMEYTGPEDQPNIRLKISLHLTMELVILENALGPALQKIGLSLDDFKSNRASCPL